MMNLTLYIFGAGYIARGKLSLAVDSLLAKPFGGVWAPDGNLKAFLKVWPHWSSYNHPKYRDILEIK